jgi:hypothetical protein
MLVLWCLFFRELKCSKGRAPRPPHSKGGVCRLKLCFSVPETARAVPDKTTCRLAGTERALMLGHIASVLRTAACGSATPPQNAVPFCGGVANRSGRRREAPMSHSSLAPVRKDSTSGSALSAQS